MKPVETLARIRRRLPALVTYPKLEPLGWIGVYGPFSRNEQTRESDINMIIGCKPDVDMESFDWFGLTADVEERGFRVFGRKVKVEPCFERDLTCVGYELIEALLTCVTVYGSENWHEYPRRQAHAMLDDGYTRLRKAHHIMSQIEQMCKSTNKKASKFHFEYH